MTIEEYKAQFHELASHFTFISTTEYKKVGYFVRGLRLPVRMSTQSLVVEG